MPLVPPTTHSRNELTKPYWKRNCTKSYHGIAPATPLGSHVHHTTLYEPPQLGRPLYSHTCTPSRSVPAVVPFPVCFSVSLPPLSLTLRFFANFRRHCHCIVKATHHHHPPNIIITIVIPFIPFCQASCSFLSYPFCFRSVACVRPTLITFHFFILHPG